MLDVSLPVAEGEAAPFGRLVSVARPCESTTLIVYFNVYVNKAFERPDLPHQTRFDALRGFLPYRAHLVWFVEEEQTWYLAHQERILATLERYIRENGIETVKLVGGSAGGYAAIRHGMLLDRRLAGAGLDVAVVTFALNPQTGFSDRLLAKVQQRIEAEEWEEDLLGRDPIVLSPELRGIFAPLQIDLGVLAEQQPVANFAVAVINDMGNPVEQGFIGDIIHWPHLHLVPHDLGIPHGTGTEVLYHEHFRPVFDEVYPVEKDDGAGSELFALDWAEQAGR